jgi:hypothetical protein
MSFIQRELSRIGNALPGTQSDDRDDRYAELYVAQQALVWASEPDVFKAPYDLIVQGVTGTLEDSEDCPVRNDLSASLDNRDPHG